MKALKLDWKITLAIALATIIIGTLLWTLVAGSFGTDFRGGTALRVQFSDILDLEKNEYETLRKQIAGELKAAGLRADNSVKLSFSDDPSAMEFIFPSIVKGKVMSESMFLALRDEIEEATRGYAEAIVLARDGVDVENPEVNMFFVSEVTFYQFGATKAPVNMILWISLCATAGMGAAAAYCGFRFHRLGYEGNRVLNGIRAALTILINTLISFILAFFLAIVFAVIFASPLQLSFAWALLIAAFYSVITAVYTLNAMRKLDIEGGEISGVAGNALIPVGSVTAAIVIAALIMGLTGTVFTAAFASAVAAGVTAAAFCSLFAMPAIWGLMKFKLNQSGGKVKSQDAE